MNLSKKKMLASKTLGVGKERIKFVKSRIDEIKEIITKQDVRDLKADGAIMVKEVKGRISGNKKKVKRSAGNIRKKVNKRKKEYVIMTRKLRNYARAMRNQDKITKEHEREIRKKIRNREFKSKAHLKEYIGGIKI